MALRWRGSVDRDPSVGSRWTPLDSDVGSRWTPPFVSLPCGFREVKQHCVSWSTMAKAASRASRSYSTSPSNPSIAPHPRTRQRCIQHVIACAESHR